MSVSAIGTTASSGARPSCRPWPTSRSSSCGVQSADRSIPSAANVSNRRGSHSRFTSPTRLSASASCLASGSLARSRFVRRTTTSALPSASTTRTARPSAFASSNVLLPAITTPWRSTTIDRPAPNVFSSVESIRLPCGVPLLAFFGSVVRSASDWIGSFGDFGALDFIGVIDTQYRRVPAVDYWITNMQALDRLNDLLGERSMQPDWDVSDDHVTSAEWRVLESAYGESLGAGDHDVLPEALEQLYRLRKAGTANAPVRVGRVDR